MSNPKKPIFLFFAFLAATVTLWVAPRANPYIIEPQKRQSDGNQLPVVDYDISALSNANKILNRSRPAIRDENGTVEITESESPIERLPAIPSAQSDAVVIGELLEARAYLTEDNREVYTQYRVVVQQVLKNQGSSDAKAGAVFTVKRKGGRVRFPSGHIQTYRLSSQGVPRVGRRHLIFLEHCDQMSDFLVLTAYELYNDRVIPVDDVESQKRYQNLSEAEFLKVVRSALTSSP